MGPLEGIRVVEIAGRGPGPFAAMMLADMGADVLRVDRPSPQSRPQAPSAELELVNRGRESIVVDLKQKRGQTIIMHLVREADVLMEGFRPGVAERLGIGPEDCLRENTGLIYARATGWGQKGPLSTTAGHDLNYIALAGALNGIGKPGEPPTIPLNLIGDFGGGGTILAFGIVCGLYESTRSGEGQVIDAAMVDGASLLMTLFHGRLQMGTWSDERGTNYLDGSAPFYSTYETKDGRYISVGAIERQFYNNLLQAIGADETELPLQWDRSSWSETKGRFREIFLSKTRAEWEALLGDRDVCFAPVLTLAEAPDHPHHKARNSFTTVSGVRHPSPAPRFSRTVPLITKPPSAPGSAAREYLMNWGLTDDAIDHIKNQGG